MNLFEVNEQIEALFDRAIDPETGEVVDDDALAELDQLEQQKEGTLFACAALVKNKKAWADSLKAHKKGIEKKLNALDNSIRSIKDYMAANFTEKIKNEHHTVYTMKTESVVLKVGVEDLPSFYQSIKIDANKKLLKGDLKNGVDIDHLVELQAKESLVIR